MFRHLKSSIPNFITSLNLLCGVVACIFSFLFPVCIGGLYGYQWTWIFIGASAVFDFCDGALARLLHAYSDLGKQLDSLSDLISFGMAPALLVFNISCFYNGNHIVWWAFLALLIVLAGAFRLAIFNIDESQKTSFRGLPIPSNAIFWIGFTAWVQAHGFPGNWILSVAIIFISYMMVCPMSMFSLKFNNFTLSDNLPRYIILAASVIFLLTLGISGFAAAILLYIVMSAFMTQKTFNGN